jgi:hypothetical protein
MSNYWDYDRSFGPGDLVQKFGSHGLSPYVGRIVEVSPNIKVAWPFDQQSTEESLAKVGITFAVCLPSSVNGFGTKSAAVWWLVENPEFYRELARSFHAGLSEVASYDDQWRRYGSEIGDRTIRQETAKFYRFAALAESLYWSGLADKQATYWFSQNRQHRATRSEVEIGRPNCPRCGTSMRRTTYKMSKGQKVKLFACPRDLYLIRQADILGPEGAPVGW